MGKRRDSNNSTDCTNSSSADERRTHKNSKAEAIDGVRKCTELIGRPSASPGYWLCCLLPMAYGAHYMHATPLPICEAAASMHRTLMVAAIGMCVQSLCFFVYMSLDSTIVLRLTLSLVPGLLTSVLYTYVQLDMDWWFAACIGFFVTILYQALNIRVMRDLPNCFSFGEAAVLVQGLVLFILSALFELHALYSNTEQRQASDEFAQLNIIMMTALLCLVVACCSLASVAMLRRPFGFYALMLVLLAAVTCLPVTEPLPVVALLQFVLRDKKRCYIIAFYLLLVGLTVATVSWQLGKCNRASTRIRKIFHLLILLVYVPGLIFDCAFLYIATGVAFGIFTVIELFRILDIPPLATRLKAAFASFKDEKDAGALALTPFCLLIGCSMPIWLTPCPCGDTATRAPSLLPLLAGVLAVGVGDTAASVFGSMLGRNKWQNSNRSLEGTAAFIIAVLLAVLSLCLLGPLHMTQAKWFAVIFATLNTALVEALTDQVDNLVLPLIFYIIVSLA